eukprot:TRINITY_DN298_c0_g1_i2.p5 TRINITY_DN298_c0_g1~~TRINITY_DN298_c0_g1_i2.p5  ORF type:complete len:114 (-),score=18.69 TRINITY_DN298_c0_g1_i2:2557-2898(-)
MQRARCGRMMAADVKRLQSVPEAHDARFAEARRQHVCYYCWEPASGGFRDHECAEKRMFKDILTASRAIGHLPMRKRRAESAQASQGDLARMRQEGAASGGHARGVDAGHGRR